MLKSINLGYDEREDRLVLRLTPDDDAEVQILHLTRRVCAAWRNDLQTLVDRSAEVPDHLRPEVKTAVSTAHHQAQVAQASIKKETPMPRPAQAPQLVVSLRCGQRRDDGRWVIRFETADGRDVTLQLSPQSLHALAKMVRDQVARAQWLLPALPSDATTITAMAEPSSLH